MTAYCAKCGLLTEKVATRDRNDETVLTCTKGHFIKIPKGSDIKVAVRLHNEANNGPG